MIRKIGLFSLTLLMFGCGTTSTSINKTGEPKGPETTAPTERPQAYLEVSQEHMNAGLATYPSCGDSRPAADTERKNASQWSVAKRCLSLIEKYEGFEPNVHTGPAGKTLIGFGHSIGPNEKYGTITLKKARELLKEDVAAKAKAVADLIKVPVSKNEFSALVCLAYNIGEGKLSGDSTLTALNNKDYRKAADEMTTLRKANDEVNKQLVARRQSECTLFLSP